MLCHMTAVQGEPLTVKEGRGWTVDDTDFGARLALVRQRMGWNIKEAARECGVPAASWASWEVGAMPRRYTDICTKIATRTGADYIWLVAGPSRLAGRPSGEVTQTIVSANLPHPAAVPRPNVPRPTVRTGRHSVLGVSPLGTGRRDSTRPVSGIPASRRRPTPTGPGNRPIPA